MCGAGSRRARRPELGCALGDRCGRVLAGRAGGAALLADYRAAAVGAALAGLVVNDVLTGTDFLRCGVLFPTGFLFAFTAGAQLDRGEARTGLGLSLALVLLDAGLTFGAPVAAVAGGVTAAVWGIGRVVRSRRLMAEELRAHTTTLRGLRDERARMEVAADRARLSGELDALLQRRL